MENQHERPLLKAPSPPGARLGAGRRHADASLAKWDQPIPADPILFLKAFTTRPWRGVFAAPATSGSNAHDIAGADGSIGGVV
jgi:hypothetical protein